MSLIKTAEEIERLRVAGKHLAAILKTISTMTVPGVRTRELDRLAEKLIRAGGDTPAFLQYTPEGASRPYPATLCLSLNDEVVHGIPNEGPDRVLKEGDIVGLDLGLIHKGMIVDSAVTVGVGVVSSEAQQLIDTTREALQAAIGVARAGNRIGDIGYAVSALAQKQGYGVVDVLGGHGVGNAVHEEPFIPNVGKKGTGLPLVPGMVLALEPMFNIGTKEVVLGRDGYTFKTRDHSLSAHFEHTVLITEGDAEVLTRA